ncbi:MAG: acetyltransferase, partial [Clostridia bacterium]|nr:acetyltransferase [Clostridia bacterium]
FISNDSSIEDFVTIQANAAVGHDVQIGSWCEIENSVFLGGGVIVGDGTTVHTHAMIKPRITVGSEATVAMGSVVIRSVPNGTTVFGNPAKRIVSPKES